MTVSSKNLAAVFFIPRHQTEGRGDWSIEDLLQTAGATDISTMPDTPFDVSGRVTCTWAGMTCKAELNLLPYHQVLHIFFLQASLMKMVGDKREPLPLEQDGGLPLALAFRDACEALAPEVAFIATHLTEAQPKYALDREWMVLSHDANALADERFGLLYLNDEISQHWTSNPIRDDRDCLPIARGRLVFAGRGWGRWF